MKNHEETLRPQRVGEEMVLGCWGCGAHSDSSRARSARGLVT